MSREKQMVQKVGNALPTAADLCNEFIYNENDQDPREAMRAAYTYTPNQKDKDNVDRNYNDFLLLTENAEAGEILNEEAKTNATKAGVLKKYEMATLKTAYELNAF